MKTPSRKKLYHVADSPHQCFFRQVADNHHKGTTAKGVAYFSSARHIGAVQSTAHFNPFTLGSVFGNHVVDLAVSSSALEAESRCQLAW